MDIETVDQSNVDTYHGPRGAWGFYSGNITIHDGTFNATNNSTGANGGATIFYAQYDKKILIENGTFTTKGKTAYIGVNNSKSYWGGGTIVNDGTFKATGTNYAYIFGTPDFFA